MFGHHKLYRDGVPARSVITGLTAGLEYTVDHKKHEQVVDEWKLPNELPSQRVYYDVVVRVEFGDGTTAEHADRLYRQDVGECHAGDVLPVRYDRQHHDKIVFDLPELEANRYSAKERADGQPPRQAHNVGLTELREQLHAARAGQMNIHNVMDLVQQIKADPEGFREQLLRTAQEGGSNTFVVTSTQDADETGFPVVSFGEDAEDI
jgi:hypothetical protein